MNPAVQKTLALLLLILIGVLLKKKIKGKDKLNGIKVLILSIALPATIFVALLKVNVDFSLLILPILALTANFSLLLVIRYAYPFLTGKSFRSAASRTIVLLIPSMAPGLSCFPFIVEYLGEETLAYAALTDIGNKFFGLIILYLVAMQWYYKVHSGTLNTGESKLKGLLISLVQEPINIVIVVALILLGFGLNMASLPEFLQNSINRLSLMMTPLVLLFIGLAVKINLRVFSRIASMLIFRSGVSFLLSALLISIFPIGGVALLLLAVIFPQSSCSFWPFAHMSVVDSLEKKNQQDSTTFDLDLALNILAVSLPFSTMVILTICSFPNYFSNPNFLFGIAIVFLVIGITGLFSGSRKTIPSGVLAGEFKD